MSKRQQSQKKGMVDVGKKKVTKRVAVASSNISMGPKAFKILMSDGSPKGNVLETAKIAGILAAKSTSQIIPLCHPLALNKVNITFDIDRKSSMISIIAEVSCHGRTGVEMEALTAVSVAALSVYDMYKALGKDIQITDIQLLEKTGGKSGPYQRK